MAFLEKLGRFFIDKFIKELSNIEYDFASIAFTVITRINIVSYKCPICSKYVFATDFSFNFNFTYGA